MRAFIKFHECLVKNIVSLDSFSEVALVLSRQQAFCSRPRVYDSLVFATLNSPKLKSNHCFSDYLKSNSDDVEVGAVVVEWLSNSATRYVVWVQDCLGANFA